MSVIYNFKSARQQKFDKKRPGDAKRNQLNMLNSQNNSTMATLMMKFPGTYVMQPQDQPCYLPQELQHRYGSKTTMILNQEIPSAGTLGLLFFEIKRLIQAAPNQNLLEYYLPADIRKLTQYEIYDLVPLK